MGSREASFTRMFKSTNGMIFSVISLLLIISLIIWTLTSSRVLADSSRQTSGSLILALETDSPSYLLNNNEEVDVVVSLGSDGIDSEIDVVVEVYITDPEGEIVFDSRDDYGETFTLRPTVNRTKLFKWRIENMLGTYTVTSIIREEENPDTILDVWTPENGTTFEVVRKPRLGLSTRNWEILGETSATSERVYEETIMVSNRGGSALTWEVTAWPNWIEVLTPTSEVTGAGEIRLRLKEFDLPPYSLTELEGDLWMASAPERTDVVKIKSNGGSAEITVHMELAKEVAGSFIKDNVVQKPAAGVIELVTVEDHRQGDIADIAVQISNDVGENGNVSLEYFVSINIRDSTGRTVYSSEEDGDERRVFIKGGSSETVIFFWDIPYTVKGDYLVGAELRYWHDRDVLFDVITGGERAELNVRTGAKVPRLKVSVESIDFGNLVQGETTEAVINIENTALSTLEWRVRDLPDWLELLSPVDPVNGPGEIRVKVRESAGGGQNDGFIRISSNGGSEAVEVFLNVEVPPTATPSPSPILPTAIPTPIPTLATLVTAPTSGPPVPTSSPSPPTATPTEYRNVLPTKMEAYLRERALAVPLTLTAIYEPRNPTSTPSANVSTPKPDAQALVANSIPRPTTQASIPGRADDDGLSALPGNSTGGGCNMILGEISLGTGVINSLLLLAPLGAIALTKRRRRRAKSSTRE